MNEKRKSPQRSRKGGQQASGGNKKSNPHVEADRSPGDGRLPPDATLQQAGMPRNPHEPERDERKPDHDAPHGKPDPTLQQAGMPRQTDPPLDEGRKDPPGTDRGSSR